MNDPFSDLLDPGGKNNCDCPGGSSFSANLNLESGDLPSAVQLEQAISSYESADLFSNDLGGDLDLEGLEDVLASGSDLMNDPESDLSSLIRLAESHPGLKISISFD